MSIAVILQNCGMDSRFAELSAVELRSKILDETRKFILVLQFGATLSELEEIRDRIKLLNDLLAIKEKEELNISPVEKFPQANM